MSHSPAELIKLNNLQLAARIISEELQGGIHTGRRIGAGTEFEQYKHYEPGDDPKRIDWKLFARSSKYLIKESTVESNLSIKFILDLSGSMNYEEDGIKRLEYAKVLLASLAFLAMQQHDKISFFTLKNGEVQQEVHTTPKSFQRMLFTLENVRAEGQWPDRAQTFPQLQSRERELVILVSDLLQTNEEWTNLVASLSQPRREIVLFQLLGQQEINFDLKGFYRFEDLESGSTLEMDAGSIREQYQKEMADYLNQLEKALFLPQVHLLRTTLDQPIADVLRQYLLKRKLY
ncbi:DUF58 domain-containing protein [Litoribacter alkaliphilus]|uniref:DUF58 domain-containing protein n=1 Tax=Litoribacter ruber TaxID=702568 RepID=A0AAP2CHL0_9BACT|nr:DUF58 domain-containing protein [Litoribacter alkaliphilus]MBS9523869.1 DUF58 domain-containing protein [Litoribacter alkaliphilus]